MQPDLVGQLRSFLKVFQSVLKDRNEVADEDSVTIGPVLQFPLPTIGIKAREMEEQLVHTNPRTIPVGKELGDFMNGFHEVVDHGMRTSPQVQLPQVQLRHMTVAQ